MSSSRCPCHRRTFPQGDLLWLYLSRFSSAVVVIMLVSKDNETQVFVIKETRVLSQCAFRPQVACLSIIRPGGGGGGGGGGVVWFAFFIALWWTGIDEVTSDDVRKSWMSGLSCVEVHAKGCT